MTRRPLTPHERRALQIALVALCGCDPLDLAHTRTRLREPGLADLRGHCARACLPPKDGWCEIIADGGGLPDERIALLRVRGDDGHALAREQIVVVGAASDDSLATLSAQGFLTK